MSQFALIDENRRAWAEITGSYRYLLGRGNLGGVGGTALFVMLNPSTADANQDDPTIRKCMGFARQWGFATLEVVNLFAWRATKPRDLERVDDPVGPRNDDAIHAASARADAIVVAWGQSLPRVGKRRVRDVLALLQPRPLVCLGTTFAGHPKHPLFLPYTTPRVEFARAKETA